MLIRSNRLTKHSGAALVYPYSIRCMYSREGHGNGNENQSRPVPVVPFSSHSCRIQWKCKPFPSRLSHFISTVGLWSQLHAYTIRVKAYGSVLTCRQVVCLVPCVVIVNQSRFTHCSHSACGCLNNESVPPQIANHSQPSNGIGLNLNYIPVGSAGFLQKCPSLMYSYCSSTQEHTLQHCFICNNWVFHSFHHLPQNRFNDRGFEVYQKLYKQI